MELLYEVREPDRQDFGGKLISSESTKVVKEKDPLEDTFRRFYFKDSQPICAVSVKHLLAFTSTSDLLKRDHNRIPTESPDGLRVYVADLNTPWECYQVCINNNKVTNLNWDHTGVKLLVATEDGLVEVYGMVENVLNKWQLLNFGKFEGEPVLTSCWLNAPRKVSLLPDKLDSILYSEKYETSVISNARGFGGRSLEGAVVVTSTALLGAVINSHDDSRVALTGVEKLLAVRNKITNADIAYSKDGELIVATSSDSLKQPVNINRIHVSLGSCRNKVEIEVKAAQSLFLPSIPPASAETEVTSIQFVNKMNSEGLLVVLTNLESRNSTLYLFELTSEHVILKPRFQTTNADPLMIQKWQQTHQISFSSSVETLCTLPIPLAPMNVSGTQPQNPTIQQCAVMQPLIAVSLANSCVHLVRCDTLQQVGIISSAGANVKSEREDGAPEPKQPRLAITAGQSSATTCLRYVALQFTWSGCLLVSLDEKCQLHVYKIHPNMDASTAATMIELSMMGGLDPWDIMMCIRPTLIDHVTDRLSETFARQPSPVQNRFNVRILVIKAALFRLSCGGMARTNDQQTLLILHLVSGALKALLRPSDLSSQDKGPAESLASLLSSKGEALSDVDKVLLHVEAKEYTVEPSLLQSLQQFLQWCADLSVKLLATLPDLRHSKGMGWEVCHDSKAIATLRELIVLMRIWGLIRSSCLPSFRKTSESLDVLPWLFRLLTRLSVTPDPDEALIDECCILPSEVQVQNINAFSSTKNHGVASLAFLARTSPPQFVFGVNPSKWLNNLESQRTSAGWVDGLRLLWLGKNPSNIKTCNRCGCATLLQAPPRSIANRSWDSRWIRNCPCGGNWKLSSSLAAQTKIADPDAFLNF